MSEKEKENQYWYSPLPATGSVDKDGKSIEKQPNLSKKFTYEEIKKLGCNYVRRVNPGFVFFDFDSEELASKAEEIIRALGYKCKKLKTTRGAHFMFKTSLEKISDGSGPNWLGLDCDIKGCGVSQTRKINCQVMRLHDEDRPETYIGFDKSLGMGLKITDDDLDEAPYFLYHAPKAARETLEQAFGMSSGDGGGRNNWMHHEYAKFCKKARWTWEQYHEAASIINTYVFGESLGDTEFTTATRQEEYDDLQVGGQDEKTLLSTQAQDVIDTWSCKSYNGEILFFDEAKGHYDNYIETIKNYLIQKYKDLNITTQKIEEILRQVTIMILTNPDYKATRNENYIVCNNKLVNVVANEPPKEMTRTIVTDIVYPYEIMSESELKDYEKRGEELIRKYEKSKADGTLNVDKAPKIGENGKILGEEGMAYKFMKDISCNDPMVEKVIWECVGCMLAPVKKINKIFIFYGSGANGKSVLLKLVKEIMGRLMTSANILNINDNFALQNVYKGICNVTDDVGITTLRETGLLKSLIDGSDIEVNIKHKDPIQWKPNSQFVMCCNEIPRIADSTKGMIRRLSFIPFELELESGEMDIFLKDKILGEPGNNGLRYIMTKGIMAHREAVIRGDLTVLPKQKELEEDFIDENKDRISQFLEYMIETHEAEGFWNWLDGQFSEQVYHDYYEWCMGQYYNNIENQKTFNTRFKKKLPQNWILGQQRFEGKNYRIYQRGTVGQAQKERRLKKERAEARKAKAENEENIEN